MSNEIFSCDGCYGDFAEWDIATSSDGKYQLCDACNYANDANLDNKTGGDDE